MFYFKYYDDKIEKYVVEFDRELVEELGVEIIDNCSLIVHHEEDLTLGPNKNNTLKIRNYHKGPKVGEYSHECGPDEPIYHFSYDEYIYPSLITIIDKLLRGDSDAIDEINNYNPEIDNAKISFNKEIEKLSRKIDLIDNLDIKNKQLKLKELEVLVAKAQLNKDRKHIDSYYEQLKELLSYELLATISTEEVKKVNRFFSKKLKRK